ncbi:MAG TPA: SRPBCC family protein [Gaiellaceae bacterium]|nr:SRPBCC family protein [Gaiellaceae bacterium]
MPRLSHSFSAPAAPDEVFALLADPGRVAGCLPGAELDPDAPRGRLAEGRELGGRIAVQLGPVGAQFRGVVRVLELDDAARRSVLGVRADDARGNGSATATITLAVAAENGGSRVDVDADVDVRGRVATFGAGMIERVSGRMVEKFGANLARALAGAGPATSAAAEPAAPAALAARDLVDARALAWPVLATGFAFACGVLTGRLLFG